MTEQLDILFDEYARRYRRGDRPDLREYLKRAGADADRLARAVERFLIAAPPPPASEAQLAVARKLVRQTPPLLRLRVSRGLRRDVVIAAVIERFGIDPGKRDKVRRRYHELESGRLDPRRADPKLLEVLAETLRTKADELLGWHPPTATAAAARFYRLDPQEGIALGAARSRRGAAEERDEIDRLFGVG
jgi:hypothetical protein